jgi:hypothetical protein
VEKIIRPNGGREVSHHFDNLTFTVPHPGKEVFDHPQYHSIVGQKLLLVNWKLIFGLDVLCPCCNAAPLANDRTNFSKNKILFPIFDVDGPPAWCMVMSMTCTNCHARFNANDSAILCRLPAYAMYAYPVDTKYAGKRFSHIGRTASNMFDLLMPTYGNGDLCSRLLYNAINRLFLDKSASYYSYFVNEEGKQAVPYVDKDEFLWTYPPTGDMI